MKNVVVIIAVVCLTGSLCVAQAVPDFQNIMDTLEGKLNAVSADMWTAEVFQYVEGPGFTQAGPNFPGAEHILNGINDDDHLALFQRVIEGSAETRAALGDAFVDGVRTAFFANQALVTNREAWFDLRLFDSTRVDIEYIISAQNRPAYTDPAIQRFTTGATNNLRLCVDTGIFIVGTTCLAESVDIPSLWGAGGLLNDGAPGLGDAMRDLLAAYLTIGDQRKVDYMQALMFQTMYRGLLPNIMGMILGLLGSGSAYDPTLQFVPEWNFDVSVLAYEPSDPIEDVDIDESYSPPLVVSPSEPYIAIRRIVARVYNSGENLSVKEGILEYWLQWYAVGANGFGHGYAERITADGDLNLDGDTNSGAYERAAGDQEAFIHYAIHGSPAMEGEASEGELVEGEPEEMPHPCDTNEDWRLVMSEAISCLQGWQSGTTPMAYAIRAAVLWQNGEYYVYDTEEEPPLCWVPETWVRIE